VVVVPVEAGKKIKKASQLLEKLYMAYGVFVYLEKMKTIVSVRPFSVKRTIPLRTSSLSSINAQASKNVVTFENSPPESSDKGTPFKSIKGEWSLLSGGKSKTKEGIAKVANPFF
jgi:hypothetical protein